MPGRGCGLSVARRLVPTLAVLLLLAAAFVVGTLPEPGSAQDAGSKVALLISNSVGRNDNPRPSKALETMASLLGRAGFAATRVEDAGRKRMTTEIAQFMNNVRPGSTVVFLFRGAILKLGEKNFLMPVDASGTSESDALRDGIEFDGIENDLSARGASVKIVILNSVGSDLVAGQFKVAPRPASGFDLHEGTLAIYNKGPGRPTGTAEDDLFLNELSKQLGQPNSTVEQAFSRTRLAVAAATQRRQIPSVSSSLLGDVVLVQGQPVLPSDAVPPPATGPDSPKTAPPPAQPQPPQQPAPTAGGPNPGEIFKDCDTCPALVVVPSGTFTMGSKDTPAEAPQRNVTIAKPFAIGRFEVTFAQWDACVAAKACKSDIDDHGFGRGQRPVIDITWDEAQAFVKWLSAQGKHAYRLPSEAEWEYAARAGSKTAFPWGAAAGTGRANCDECGAPATQATLPVGSYRPNAFGLFDTAGNAAELVEDCWNPAYRGAPVDGSAWRTGDCQLRVLRGGSFGNKATSAKSSARFRYDHDVRYYTNGFRVARDLP